VLEGHPRRQVERQVFGVELHGTPLLTPALETKHSVALYNRRHEGTS
jgi:hypothetical protein